MSPTAAISAELSHAICRSMSRDIIVPVEVPDPEAAAREITQALPKHRIGWTDAGSSRHGLEIWADDPNDPIGHLWRLRLEVIQ